VTLTLEDWTVDLYSCRVAIPEVIPIAYEPWARTAKIGRYERGLFYGSLTGAYPRSYSRRSMRDQWREYNRFYAVLHRFDHDGHFVDSDIWFEGTVAEPGTDRAEDVLSGWLAALPGLSYGPIAIRPFQTIVDDVLFGLVTDAETDDEGHVWERAVLYPEDLCFGPPWDGLYST
jgi:formate hydrogenlyase regulatory protein HycA